MNDRNTLMVLGKASQLLAKAKKYDEAKKIHGEAEALRAYCQQQKLSLECYNYAAEIKLRAERKMGSFLALTEKNKGGEHSHKKPTSRGAPTGAPTLKEMEISKDESAKYQRLARIPEQVFADIVEETTQAREPLTTQRVLREAGSRCFGTTSKRSEATAATTTSPDGKVVVQVDLLLKEEQRQPFLDALQILGEDADQLIFDTVITAARGRKKPSSRSVLIN